MEIVVQNSVVILLLLLANPGGIWSGAFADRPFGNERSKYFEGDILLQPDTRAGSDAARWAGAVIPYLIHRNIGQNGRKLIQTAMKDIESKTCIRFKPRNGERNYVWVTNFNQGCFSYVGNARRGGQTLNLGRGCFHKTTVIHEFVHAVGFWHEQSREDRDKFVTVQWNNIARNYWSEFRKHSGLNHFGTDYDYRSVMHYSFNAFAKDYSRPTITTKRQYPLRLLGKGDHNGGLTEVDALQINRMYNCKGS